MKRNYVSVDSHEAARPLLSVGLDRMDPTERKGFMSEWGTALGLSLKLTTQTFAPADGKPRDPVPVTPAEVIDIHKAVAEVAPVAPETPTENPTRVHARKEEVHA